MAGITTIEHPLELALRTVYGDRAYDKLAENCRQMGFDYFETLEYGQLLWNMELFYPPANQNNRYYNV